MAILDGTTATLAAMVKRERERERSLNRILECDPNYFDDSDNYKKIY
jgi:hypothetical protein